MGKLSNTSHNLVYCISGPSAGNTIQINPASGWTYQRAVEAGKLDGAEIGPTPDADISLSHKSTALWTLFHNLLWRVDKLSVCLEAIFTYISACAQRLPLLMHCND